MAPAAGQHLSEFLAKLQTLKGRLYVYGAAGPSTFDCSGLIQYALGDIGINIGRTTGDMYAATKRVTKSQLAPGDLVFFHGKDGVHGHVGVYLGNGRLLEAPRTWISPGVRGRVREVALSSKGTPTGYGRIPGLGAGGRGGTTTGGGGDDSTPRGGNTTPTPGADDALFPGLDDLKGLAKEFESFGKLTMLLLMPTTWVRIASGSLGVIFIVSGIYFLVPKR